LIGRSTVLTLMAAMFFGHPQAAFAAVAAQVASIQASHVVTFVSNGATTQHVTGAASVGAFLKERGLSVNDGDFVSPAAEAPLTGVTEITYRAAVPVTLVTAKSRRTFVTAAADVGAFLEAQNVYLGKRDEVSAALSDPLAPHEVIRITRVNDWTKTTKQHIAQRVIKRIDFSLPPGATRIIAQGTTGLRETVLRFTQRDSGHVQRRVIATRIVRKPKTRIIAQGIGEYAAYARLAKFGLQKTSYIAASAMTMVATAYTAGCYGCTGITASGYRAGHGIVAVDPRVIPLGTHLYIPGYGPAIAGDTGGAIVGNRIDLGFNSLSDALQFGRRAVTVYRLR